MALQPVGPLSASTYWRRRAVLVGTVLVVLLLVKSCGGSAPDKTATVQPSGGPAASSAAAAPSAPAVPAPASAPPATAAPATVPTCPDSVLDVTTVADTASFRAGGAPRFTLTVRNTGTSPCQRALGPGAVQLQVLSGQDRIWSSADCSPGTAQTLLTLAPGTARATTVQWPGRRTRPGCVIGATAQPGTYRVVARLGELVRTGSVFRITA
jgi:hypothetical protein